MLGLQVLQLRKIKPGSTFLLENNSASKAYLGVLLCVAFTSFIKIFRSSGPHS